MAKREPLDELVRWLNRFSAGTLQATVDGEPVAQLDADKRDLTVQIDLLLEESKEGHALLQESHLRLWEVRGIPSALARSGWHVSLRAGPTELIGLGRNASALTGHVHVSPSGLWKLRRML